MTANNAIFPQKAGEIREGAGAELPRIGRPARPREPYHRMNEKTKRVLNDGDDPPVGRWGQAISTYGYFNKRIFHHGYRSQKSSNQESLGS
jgi:hypothetical protein